jgi:hypothetical protein
MSVDNNPDTGTAEFIERCEAFLFAAHDLVLVHIESSHTTTNGLSPRDQAFTLQQRAQFLDHLQVSVSHLESIIEYKEALAAIFHGRPWKSTNTSVSTRTYNDLVQYYLSTQYSLFSSLSPDTPSRGGKAFGISDDPNASNREQGNNKKRRRGKGKGEAGKGTATPSVSSTGSDARAHVPQTQTADHRFYCAVHGHNITHNGVNCRTMLRDQNVYTRQHLQARQPGDCTNPAGNANLQYLRPRLH